ncbi:hypothetical protein [Amycolatopsis sp. CA-230715]|uniref:hypothetical protein n=1 Tax=Amycolatopsis sp. CA-230715 TaxID=2745196 RepID=UPI001C0222DA|nr:hypothetical protein [Amycolatopsis sp. CA-230715]QWF82313.1 hypothetical protein HUW46_05750 [Amycolatopsis sp. CA-230715]
MPIAGVVMAGLAVTMPADAAASTTGPRADVLDPALALVSSELPAVGAPWTDHPVKQNAFAWDTGGIGVCSVFDRAPLYQSVNLRDTESAGRTDSNDYYTADTWVVRLASASEAAKAKASWAADLASCPERLGPPGQDNGAFYVTSTAKVDTVNGVDVWGVHWGSGYLPPNKEGYIQTFAIQKDSLLSVVTVHHQAAVAPPHPAIPARDTVLAAQRRLGL